MLTFGGSIAFYSGDNKKLPDDMIVCRPTIMIGVPRVFQRIYNKVFEGAAAVNCIKKWYFNRAYEGQVDNVCQFNVLSMARLRFFLPDFPDIV